MLSCPAGSNGIPSIFNQQQNNNNSNNNGLGWLGFHLPVLMRILEYSTGRGKWKRKKKSNLQKKNTHKAVFDLCDKKIKCANCLSVSDYDYGNMAGGNDNKRYVSTDEGTKIFLELSM